MKDDEELFVFVFALRQVYTSRNNVSSFMASLSAIEDLKDIKTLISSAFGADIPLK